MEGPESIPGGEIGERNSLMDLIVVCAVVAAVFAQFARQVVGMENSGVEDGFLVVIDPVHREFPESGGPTVPHLPLQAAEVPAVKFLSYGLPGLFFSDEGCPYLGADRPGARSEIHPGPVADL